MDTEGNLSKVDILRALVIDKMTVTLHEVLAVVETTIAGYEAEIVSLKRDLSHNRRKLDAVLQPKVALQRIDVRASDLIVTDGNTDEQKLQQKNIDDSGAADKCKEVNKDDCATTETLLEPEESDCGSAGLPSDFSVNREEEECRTETINEAEKDKNRRKLPRRKRKVTDGDDDWTPNKCKRLNSSNVKGKLLIKLRIGFLKNSPTTDLSNTGTTMLHERPVQTVLCQKDLSESDFMNQLRSTFSELGENKPFAAYLVDNSKGPDPHKRMTAAELYTAFRSHEEKQFDFYIQLKEHEDSSLLNSEEPIADDAEEAATRVKNNVEPTDEEDYASSIDSAAQNDDDDDDYDWEEEAEEDKPAPKPKKTARKKRQKIKRKPQKLFSGLCKVCGLLFRSEMILVRHVVKHLDHPESKCGVCGQRLASSQELSSHLETHKTLYECDKCGCCFLNRSFSRTHKKTCQKDLNSSTAPIKPTLDHEQPYKCDLCPESFEFSGSLERHYRTHTREQRLQQKNISDSATSDKCTDVNEDDSVGTETLVEPEESDLANLPSDASANREQEELRTDTINGKKQRLNAGPYTCDICGKTLADFGNLCRHVQTHSKQKAFTCKTCGKLFVSHGYLKIHERIHSERERKYLCEICSKSFFTELTLRGHQKIHDESFAVECPVCKKSIRGGLKHHMLTHSGEKPFSCSECDQKFISRKQLTQHCKIHLGLKPFRCTVCEYTCGRAEHLKIHMRTHTGEKPYRCSLCDKSFTQSHCLKSHMKSHNPEELSTGPGASGTNLYY